MARQQYITITLSPRERNYLLRILKEDDSGEAESISWTINWELRNARYAAKRERASEEHSARYVAAQVIAGMFAERHQNAFPGAGGGLNRNVGRWVEHRARLALGLKSYQDEREPSIRPEYRPRIEMGLAALLDELRTPAGMKRAANFEAKRLRSKLVTWRREPPFGDSPTSQDFVARTEAKADELERAASLPGLAALME
jgi:hypothetical protein